MFNLTPISEEEFQREVTRLNKEFEAQLRSLWHGMIVAFILVAPFWLWIWWLAN